MNEAELILAVNLLRLLNKMKGGEETRRLEITFFISVSVDEILIRVPPYGQES